MRANETGNLHLVICIEIKLIISRFKIVGNPKNVVVHPGAECGLRHNLLVMDMKIRLKVPINASVKSKNGN